MCCRPMRLRSKYRRMGVRRTVRVTCGSIGRERDMEIPQSSCMNTRRPGKQTIRGIPERVHRCRCLRRILRLPEAGPGNRIHCLCRVLLTHARRYFADALKALPKKEYEAAKDTVAYEAIKRISAIYHLDNQLADLKPDDRRKQRQINLKPLVEAFFAWAKEIRESGRLIKGKTLEGINYCINPPRPPPHPATEV